EPRGVLAVWDGAATKMTVSGAAKVPFAGRKILARCMDLPEECVDLIESDVGGGFGVRGEFYCEDFLIPFVARKLDRPVKWIEDRRENLLTSNHSREIDMDLEIACEKDGTIVGLRGQAAAQRRAVRVGALSDRQHPHRFLGHADQQEPDRHLSRAGPV